MSDIGDKHIIAYTDGSAIPNPGLSGYGVHICMYGGDDKKSKIKSILGKYSITNIGYMSRVMFKVNEDKNIVEVPVTKIIDLYGYEDDCDTNNTAELHAVYNLLKLITNPLYEKIFNDLKTVTINIDSTYVINGIEKILNGVDVVKNINANKHIFLKLDKILKELKNINIELTILKVKGHSNDLGNDRADLLADMGRLLRKNIDGIKHKIIIENRDDYYGNRVNRDPMLFTSFLFNYNINKKQVNDDIFYCGVNYKDELDIGKPGNDICYTILYKETTDKELITLSEISNEIIDNTKTPNVLLLNNYYNKEVYNNLRMYGDDYTLLTNNIIKKIITVDDVEIVKEIYPPGVSYKAFDIHEELISYLNVYRFNESPGNHIIIDITNEYFIKDNDKTILNPEIKNDKYKVKINLKEILNYKKKLTLIMGLDLLKRNNLKKIEKQNIKIDLVIIKYKTYFKYFTITSIIDTDDKKKYLLTSNYYTNLIYL